MGERDEKPGGLGCAITDIALILLPVLYVLGNAVLRPAGGQNRVLTA